MSSSVEMCGGELVCRLVAATPPYLYSPAGLPHCFFFSELLRGLVEARAKRPASPPPSSISAHQKRFRLAGPDSAFSTPPNCPLSPRKTSHSSNTSNSILPRLQHIYATIGEQKRKEPLPAVIGLELVVDYVKHERKEPKQ
ncbi:hypothetical protein O3M35_008239 [Rhynocoris fuscipes]|uniref:Uncharacterized protein n=1 Tax=Rhynocoris fuscipes TaxID=488301 RepID=A0AAW1D7W5_9HEMI